MVDGMSVVVNVMLSLMSMCLCGVSVVMWWSLVDLLGCRSTLC